MCNQPERTQLTGMEPAFSGQFADVLSHITKGQEPEQNSQVDLETINSIKGIELIAERIIAFAPSPDARDLLTSELRRYAIVIGRAEEEGQPFGLIIEAILKGNENLRIEQARQQSTRLSS